MLHLGLSAQSSAVTEHAQKLTHILDAYVDLTSNQETQIVEINETRLTEIEQANGNDVTIKQITQTRINEVKAVLTPAQLALLEQRTAPGTGRHQQF